MDGVKHQLPPPLSIMAVLAIIFLMCETAVVDPPALSPTSTAGAPSPPYSPSPTRLPLEIPCSAASLPSPPLLPRTVHLPGELYRSDHDVVAQPSWPHHHRIPSPLLLSPHDTIESPWVGAGKKKGKEK